jgi:hypothetical protein
MSDHKMCILPLPFTFKLRRIREAASPAGNFLAAPRSVRLLLRLARIA